MFPRPSPSHCGGFACLFSAGTSCPWSCVWPLCPPRAQLEHHLLQTHLDSDHPSLGLGVCPLYFLGIKWIHLWCCYHKQCQHWWHNITEAACALHNVPNTVQALHKHDYKTLSSNYCYSHFTAGDLEAREIRFHVEAHSVRKVHLNLDSLFQGHKSICLSVSFHSLWFLGRQENVLHLYIPVTR